MIARSQVIDITPRVRIPFSVSLLALCARLRHSAEPAELAQRRRVHQRRPLGSIASVVKMEVVDPFPSEGNFILAWMSAGGSAVYAVVERRK